MAIKDKLLASAQKSIAKGQTTRAIKDYQKIAELDPKDMRSRQKLADLCSKAGMKSDALDSYEVVAKNFADKGFYLKAIAVYKQMQRIDSSQVNIYQKLAELNEKQGLIANAVSEYRTLVKHYEQNEMQAEAIDVLQKMKALDPENLNIRIKIAELYASTSDKAEGLKEFADVLALLRDKQNFTKIIKLYEVFTPLFPGEIKLGSGFSEACLKTGQIDKGLKILKGALKENPDDVEVLGLLVDAYHQQKDYSNEKLTLKHLLKNGPDHLDYRLKYICACFNLGEKERVLNELEEWKEAFFEAKRIPELKQLYERLHKSMQNDDRVLRTLRSIYEISGDGDKLFKIMSQLSEEGAVTPLEILETAADDMLDDSIMGTSDDDLQEIEIAEADVIEELDAMETIELESVDEVVEELEELEEVEDLEELDEVEEVEEVEESLDLELEIELDLDEPEETVLEISEDDIQDVSDDAEIIAALEEIEFYLQQGLFADAERACLGLLENAPENEKVQSKLAEIREKMAEDASAPREEYIDLAAEVMASTEDDEEEDLFDLSDDHAKETDAVTTEITIEDAESYYNLGIAYKEMGLIEDAIAEFDKAMKNATRLVDSLVLKAMCLAETGDADGAEQIFWAVLEQPDLGDEERIALQYELGLFYENNSKVAEAIAVFEDVTIANSGYRDVAKKLASLKAGPSTSDAPASAKKNRVSYI